jgi:hypothetical protein
MTGRLQARPGETLAKADGCGFVPTPVFAPLIAVFHGERQLIEIAGQFENLGLL